MRAGSAGALPNVTAELRLFHLHLYLQAHSYGSFRTKTSLHFRFWRFRLLYQFGVQLASNSSVRPCFRFRNYMYMFPIPICVFALWFDRGVAATWLSQPSVYADFSCVLESSFPVSIKSVGGLGVVLLPGEEKEASGRQEPGHASAAETALLIRRRLVQVASFCAQPSRVVVMHLMRVCDHWAILSVCFEKQK